MPLNPLPLVPYVGEKRKIIWYYKISEYTFMYNMFLEVAVITNCSNTATMRVIQCSHFFMPAINVNTYYYICQSNTVITVKVFSLTLSTCYDSVTGPWV